MRDWSLFASSLPPEPISIGSRRSSMSVVPLQLAVPLTRRVEPLLGPSRMRAPVPLIASVPPEAILVVPPLASPIAEPSPVQLSVPPTVSVPAPSRVPALARVRVSPAPELMAPAMKTVLPIPNGPIRPGSRRSRAYGWCWRSRSPRPLTARRCRECYWTLPPASVRVPVPTLVVPSLSTGTSIVVVPVPAALLVSVPPGATGSRFPEPW